jgi:ornithine cyclodeaminase/alanine dehydrogenase-like protein (mu-crystallin family)
LAPCCSTARAKSRSDQQITTYKAMGIAIEDMGAADLA